jgi:hypothetical protein
MARKHSRSRRLEPFIRRLRLPHVMDGIFPYKYSALKPVLSRSDHGRHLSEIEIFMRQAVTGQGLESQQEDHIDTRGGEDRSALPRERGGR